MPYEHPLQLLAQQIKSLEKAFLNEAGLRERMTRARIEQRNKEINPSRRSYSYQRLTSTRNFENRIYR
jgi:hypothetical protein